MAGEIAGFKGELSFSTSTSGAVAQLVSLTDFSLNVTASTIDVTTHDSSGTRDRVPGIVEWDGSAELAFVIAAATQKAAYDVLVGRVPVLGEFRPTGSSSDGYYSGVCIVTGFSISSPNEDKLGASVSFAGTGVLTRSSSST